MTTMEIGSGVKLLVEVSRKPLPSVFSDTCARVFLVVFFFFVGGEGCLKFPHRVGSQMCFQCSVS